jgi:predicted dehydrogenase
MGLKLQVGHVERFNPALAALSAYKLNPMFIEAHRLAQFKTRATDVSVIHDLMIHDIDIVLHLVKSKVKAIDANGVAVITDTTDICNARLMFENGAVANLTASRISARPMRKMRFFEQDAYISCDFGKPEVEIFEIADRDIKMGDGSVPATMLGSIEAGTKNRNIYFKKPAVPEINAIKEEHLSFIDAIANNKDVSVTGRDATEALRIAEYISQVI